mmetsp:Transcript_99097/g.206581  ORF Transcript_99097/g.206581 Transcript_99097/m.206581 type:complete len:84 (-) Transcript_99097:19-270(-)
MVRHPISNHQQAPRRNRQHHLEQQSPSQARADEKKYGPEQQLKSSQRMKVLALLRKLQQLKSSQARLIHAMAPDPNDIARPCC